MIRTQRSGWKTKQKKMGFLFVWFISLQWYFCFHLFFCFFCFAVICRNDVTVAYVLLHIECVCIFCVYIHMLNCDDKYSVFYVIAFVPMTAHAGMLKGVVYNRICCVENVYGGCPSGVSYHQKCTHKLRIYDFIEMQENLF